MHEALFVVDKARRRWRAIALALGLAHLLVLVGVYLLVQQLRLAQEAELAQRRQAILAETQAIRLQDISDGMVQAAADQGWGHYSLKLTGIASPWEREHARLLNERYGVEMHRVAGCVLLPRQGSKVEGYNAVSREFLAKKFGKDIDAECAQEAEKRWHAENPK